MAKLLSHRSVRSFAPLPLEEGTLEALIAAAQSAATSSNLQAWSVVAVEDAGRKARLSELAGRQKQVMEAPLLLVWLADLSRLAVLGAERGQQTDALDYLEMLFVAVIDAALAAQNATVAAESLGLGTVYIGALRNHPEAVAAELALPPRVLPVFGLCIGHPDPSVVTGVKPRLPQSAVLHRETYSGPASAADVRGYDAAITAFQAEQAIAQVPWSQQALARVAGPQSLSGRDRLKDALVALGFPLR
ncbi:MAG: NADPH-dependent oxidoreductase [Burkholderiales bacterium]|nr:NADPH-dependent oxidoreductase [Burkholderiales bacterium]